MVAEGKIICSDACPTMVTELMPSDRNTHCLHCLLDDLAWRGQSLGSWQLSSRRRWSFAGRRLSLTRHLASSWPLRCSRARWSLGCLLGGSRRQSLLLRCGLRLWFDINFGCRCCCRCCGLCSWGSSRLKPQNYWFIIFDVFNHGKFCCLIECGKRFTVADKALIWTCFCGAAAAWPRLFCGWTSGATQVWAFWDCRAAAGCERSRLTPMGRHVGTDRVDFFKVIIIVEEKIHNCTKIKKYTE